MTGLTRLSISEQLYARCLALAGGSKLTARLLFERACLEAVHAEQSRLAAQTRAAHSRLLDPRRRHGLVWR